MTASEQDDWIPARPIGSSARGKSYGPQNFHLAGLPVLDMATIETYSTGQPADNETFKNYLAPIKVLIWNWFDANRERKLGTFKVIIFNFTLKVKHCEALIELILGERV